MANNNQNSESKTYKQQAGEFYNRQYDNWVPWVEDKYLQWFTKDNKASYATKRTFPHQPTLTKASPLNSTFHTSISTILRHTLFNTSTSPNVITNPQ